MSFYDRAQERVFDSPRLATAISIGAVLAFSGLAFQQYLLSVSTTLARPLGFSYTGGFVAYAALHPLELYAPVELLPHLPTIYGPVFPWLLAAFHASLGEPFSVFQAGRLLNRWIILVTAYACYRFVRNESGYLSAGLLAAGLYLLAPMVSGVTTQLRVDHLGLLAALLAIFAYERRTGWNRLEWVIALSSVAVFTKQTFVVLPIALTIAYWYDEGLGRAWSYAATQLAVLIILLVAAVALTDGRFLTHLLTYNAAQAFDLHKLIALTNAAIIVYGPVILLGIVVVSFTRELNLPASLVVFAVAATTVAVVTSGKEGAWIGYYLSVIASCALFTGLALGGLLNRVESTKPMFRWAMVGLLLISGIQFGIYAAHPLQPEYDADAQRYLNRVVMAADGPVLSEDAGLLIGTRSEMEVFDPLLMKGPAARGVWDDQALIGRIHDREFAYIITRTRADSEAPSRWSPAIRSAVRQQYDLVEVTGGYYVYAPEAP